MKEETRKQILAKARRLSNGNFLRIDEHGFVTTEDNGRVRNGRPLDAKHGTPFWKKLRKIQDKQVLDSFFTLLDSGLSWNEAISQNVRP
ncbi:MAG: hypothetical protein ACXQTI_06540 [Candidatus Nezhaarchaeales archaeon]